MATRKRARQSALSWAAAGGPVAPQPASGRGRGSRRPPRIGAPGLTDLGDGASLLYAPGAAPPARFADLTTEVDWLQRDVTVFGRTGPQKRLVAYQASPGVPPYTYSRLTLDPAPFSPSVLAARDAVVAAGVAAGVPAGALRFNACLCNLYRSGADAMGWHADAERAAYGDARDMCVGSASFGEAREFFLRRAADPSDRLLFRLGAGDVLLMLGATQAHWQHAVPARAGVAGARVNLTFRRDVRAAGWWGEG